MVRKRAITKQFASCGWSVSVRSQGDTPDTVVIERNHFRRGKAAASVWTVSEQEADCLCSLLNRLREQSAIHGDIPF